MVRVEIISHVSYCLLHTLSFLNMASQSLFSRHHFWQLDLCLFIYVTLLKSRHSFAHTWSNLFRESSVIKVTPLVSVKCPNGMKNGFRVSLNLKFSAGILEISMRNEAIAVHIKH